jgi:hypothetical protein
VGWWRLEHEVRVLFWDRNNRRTVRSDQLFRINYVAEVIQGDPQERDMLKGDIADLMKWEKTDDGDEYPGLLAFHEIQVADLGYKSEKCPSHMNWDLHVHSRDLVFLELIDE